MLLSMLAIYFASGTGLPGSERTFDLIKLVELAHTGQLHFGGPRRDAHFPGDVCGASRGQRSRRFRSTRGFRSRTSRAPTAVSVILAGVMLKMGAYGILRISYPIMPEQTRLVSAGLDRHCDDQHRLRTFCAMAQKDMKRMVAYSSVNHMGYCLLGMAAVMGNPNAAHARDVRRGAANGEPRHHHRLFVLAGWRDYDRAHTRDIDAFGGLAARIPIFAGLMIMQANGFVGFAEPGRIRVSEFLCFLGGFGGSFGP